MAAPGADFPDLSPGTWPRAGRPLRREESCRPHDTIFSRGDRNVDFFLVVDGSIEIFDWTRRQPHVFTPSRAAILRRARPLQQPRHPGERPRRRGFAHRAGQARGFPPPRRQRAGHRRDHHARLHPAPRRPDPPRTRRRVADRPGHAADTLTLQRFLGRNGFPHRIVDSETDPDARGLLGRFELDQSRSAGGRSRRASRCCASPSTRHARRPARADGGDRSANSSTTWRWSAPGRPGSPRPSMPLGRAEDDRRRGHGAGRAGRHQLQDRELSGLPDRHIGPGAGRPGAGAGAEIRCAARHLAHAVAASIASPRRTGSSSKAAGRSPPGRSWSPPARATASWTSPDFRAFEGQGIHYAATAMEAELCVGEEVVVVGGGNSAGQAAVFLSRIAGHVHVLVRGSGLAATMSDYLVQRIECSPQDHAASPYGDHRARRRRSPGQVDLDRPPRRRARSARHGQPLRHDRRRPEHDWLDGCLDLDDKGFVLTGAGAGAERRSPYATARAGHIRGRRRALRLGEARRLGRRRGLGRHPGDPPLPESFAGLAPARRCGQATCPGRLENRPCRPCKPAAAQTAPGTDDEEQEGSLTSRLGPGLITGAADDDPSGIATYSQAGAQFRFGLVWTLFLTSR